MFSHSPDREAKTPTQLTPLHFAARYVPRKADDPPSSLSSPAALYMSASSTIRSPHDDEVFHRDMMNYLVNEIKVDVQCKSKLDGSTPLHLACQRGNHIAVEVLLKAQGIRLDEKDKSQRTPIHEACLRGHKGVVDELRKKGARITLKDGKGHTPLHLCCIDGHVAVAETLLNEDFADAPITDDEEGDLVNAQDLEGNTALLMACKSGNLKLVELLAARTDVSLTNDEGLNPLHVAAQCGHEEVVKALLVKHFSVKVKNYADEQTPLHYAAQHNRDSIVELLLDE